MMNEVIDIIESAVMSPEFYIGKDYGGSANNWPHNKRIGSGVKSVLYSVCEIENYKFDIPYCDPNYEYVDVDKYWDLKCEMVSFTDLKYIDINFDDEYSSILIRPIIKHTELPQFKLNVFRKVSKYFGLYKETLYKTIDVDEFKYSLSYKIIMGKDSIDISNSLVEELYEKIVANRNDLVTTSNILKERLLSLK